MSGELSVRDHIRQLNDARKLVLSDVKYYPAVVKGILPIITTPTSVDLQRWGADFLAEAFASPALSGNEKATMVPFVLDTLQSVLEASQWDVYVLRSVIQAAASAYPIALRWIIENAYDSITWERMSAVKTRILQIWDKAGPSVRICCVKFAQRVVLAQSAIPDTELRRDVLDISLDKVPPNHSILDQQTLEAEAIGLLDRMLGVLQDNSSDALLVDATVNCLSVLVRTRPGTSNRIINAVLSFNPLRLVNSPMSPKDRVMAKSMEKTIRMFLIHLSKRDPHNPLMPRIHQHVERMMRIKAEIFDEISRKRPLEPQLLENAEAKRQRIVATLPAASMPQQREIPALGPGPHTLGEVFNLGPDNGVLDYDVGALSSEFIARLTVATLAGLDPIVLAKSIAAVLGRLTAMASEPSPALNPNTAPLGVEEDDDYEPDFFAAEDTEQILNKLDSSPSDLSPKAEEPSLPLEAFRLPTPPPLTLEEAVGMGRMAIDQVVLGRIKPAEETLVRKANPGWNRFAASTRGDRDSWLTILTRVASRSRGALEDIVVKKQDSDVLNPASVSDQIRDALYTYILEDFRKRIDVAISWLCEEWFSEKIQAKRSADSPHHYRKLVLRLLDGILPYLRLQDKVLTRFLGEIPELDGTILSRIKQMCRDPTVVPLALTSLLYLVMMKPPARELALDTVQEIWTEYEDARPMAAKYLSKYRPAWLEAAARDAGSGDGTNGVTGA